MLNRYRQTGALLLVTIVFLMAAGGAMLYAMSNLSAVSSATSMVAHNGNMALAAAQSGLKYCVVQLGIGPCLANPIITVPPTPAPCAITIAETCSGAVTPSICPITSTAICPSAATCPNATDPYCGAKKLSIQVQKTTGGYQMIPASRQVLPLP